MPAATETLPVFRSILPIQVRFSDIDMMGHVSNTVYQNYYDTGKVQYFDQVVPEMDYVTVGVVGASIRIEFLKPIFLKMRILVKTRVVALGHKSFTMEQELVDEATGEVLSTCTAVLVCYANQEQVTIPMPEQWRRSILAYDRDVAVK
jgi:acyl-CoA thioester hydrolase